MARTGHLDPEDFPIHDFDRRHWPMINGLSVTRDGFGADEGLRTTSGVIAVD